MITESTELTDKNQKESQKKKHPNLRIFLICFLISVVLWLMIKLSREQNQLVFLKINYTGIHDDKIILPERDSVLFVEIQTSGYNVMFRKLFPKDYELQIDLSDKIPEFNGNRFEMSIESNVIHEQVVSMFSKKDKILHYIPSTLKIGINKAFSKKVPVVPDVSYSLKNDYSIYNKTYITPDSVLLFGDQDVISKIEFIRTEKVKFKELSENTTVSLRLLLPFTEDIKLSDQQIKFFIPVAKQIDEVIELPVIVDSVYFTERKASFKPDKIRVFYSVLLPDKQRVQTDSFKIMFIRPDIGMSENSIKVKLKNKPSFVTVKKIEPEIIVYSFYK